jgi:hypothetical protein
VSYTIADLRPALVLLEVTERLKRSTTTGNASHAGWLATRIASRRVRATPTTALVLTYLRPY